MAPMSSISGRVIGADGKPAAHVHVMAAEITYQNGARVLNQVQGVETNDRGDYRLFWLPPGRYYVGAFPEGLRRRQTAVPFGPPGEVVSLNQTFPQAFIQYRAGANGEVLEDVYETVYAPGETNLQSARVIDLRAGADFTAVDVSLAGGQRAAAAIRGTVLDGTTGQPVPQVSVRAVPRIGGPVIFSPTATTDTLGRFEIAGVMAGSYSVIATLTLNNVRQSAVLALDVGGKGVDGVRLLLTSGLRINGRISVDGAPSDEYRVGLSPEAGPLIPIPTGGQSSNGMFSFSDIYAGTYRVGVFPNADSTQQSYVKTVRLGGVELPDNEFRPGDSVQGELEILMGRNGGALEGNVVDARRSLAVNVMVALVPVGSRRADRYKTVTTNDVGHFRFQGIPPGNYVAIALPWIRSGLPQYPEFFRAIENRATPVSITEGSNRDIELSLQPEVDF
jgi:5-hydroxyisourate hydrolase-like protein (transthyretin family)